MPSIIETRRDATWPRYRAFVYALTTALPRHVAAALTLTLIVSLADGAAAIVLVPLLGAVGIDVGGAGAGSLSTAVRRVLGIVGLDPRLPVVLVLYVTIVACHALASRRQTIALFDVEHRFNAILRERLYAAITYASWRQLAASRASAFAHLLTDEVNRVGTVTHQTLSLVANTVVTLVFVGIALRVSPSLTVMVLAGGGIALVLRRSTLKRAMSRGRDVAGSTQRLYVAAVEHIAALRTAKSYGAEQRHIQSLTGIVDDVAGAELNAVRVHAASRAVLEIAAALVLAGTLYVGLVRLHLPPASVLVLLYVVARTLPRLSALHLSLEQIFQFLPSFVAIDDAIGSLVPDRAAMRQAPPFTFSREVRLERITVVHAGDRTGLDDVSLEIPFGACVAITGPSGAGKSTLGDVLSGLLSPDGGQVIVDDVPLTAELASSWTELIGYVDQDTFLFHDTIRANLLWARPSATDADILDALRSAAADFVLQLPASLETVVGDRGHRLSGGERQRLALARALIRRPRLLVLDEATSALDAEHERRILDVIDRLKGRLTIVVITHREAVLRSADTVHVIARGRLVESVDCGTLTAQQGRLAHAEHRVTPSSPTWHS